MSALMNNMSPDVCQYFAIILHYKSDIFWTKDSLMQGLNWVIPVASVKKSLRIIPNQKKFDEKEWTVL